MYSWYRYWFLVVLSVLWQDCNALSSMRSTGLIISCSVNIFLCNRKHFCRCMWFDFLLFELNSSKAAYNLCVRSSWWEEVSKGYLTKNLFFQNANLHFGPSVNIRPLIFDMQCYLPKYWLHMYLIHTAVAFFVIQIAIKFKNLNNSCDADERCEETDRRCITLLQPLPDRCFLNS